MAVDPKYWNSFAVHAAPSAIEHQLKIARVAATLAQREVVRLTELLATRNNQIAAGLWPGSIEES